MEILSHPTLLAFAVALLCGLLASFALGLWQRGRIEADAGIQALCAVKWRDYAHLVEDLLHERGFSRTGEERSVGEGGFDLLMSRGSSRYLIDCKNGAAHRVTEQAIRDLAALVEHHGAEGAVMATTGRVEPAALQLASTRRIEVLAGPDLWRQVKPWVPHDLRSEAEARARGGIARRLVLTVVVSVIGGVVAAARLPAAPDRAPAPVVARDAAPAPAPAPAPTPSTVPTTPPTVPSPEAATAATPSMPPALPDTTLDEEELAARRATAALEVRGNPIVQDAVWSTKSTLVVTLHQHGAEIPDALFDEVCRILVQQEEMRFTRVQIESPAVDPGAPVGVRWRQCR